LNLLFNKVTEGLEEYKDYYSKYEEKIQKEEFEKLKNLRNELQENLKEFDLNYLSNEDKDKIFNEIDEESKLKLENLRENYKKMNLLHNEFKSKEIEIIKESLVEESKNLEEKMIDTMKILIKYKQNYKHFILKKNEEAQYESGLNILKETKENFNRKKLEVYENRIKIGIQNVNKLLNY
jgi:hypothetical protein